MFSWGFYRKKDLEKFVKQNNEMLLVAGETIADLQHAVLGAHRICRDLAIAFRVALDAPSEDVRDDLDELIDNLSNVVAQIEEQVIS